MKEFLEQILVLVKAGYLDAAIDLLENKINDLHRD
jgi:hypothetical protein